MALRINSPKRYAEDILGAEVARLQLNKESTADHAADFAALLAAISSLSDAITAFEARLSYARGQSALVSGTVDIPVTGIQASDIVLITVIEHGGGVPGDITWTVSATDTLQVNSTSALDKSSFSYAVWVAP